MGSLTKATTETFGTGGVNSTNIQNDSITNAKIASDAAIANSKLEITFPTISSLSITNGQPAVYDTETVDINGTDFTNGARVDFIHSTTNAVLNLPTVTFVSATQLRVTIPASTLTEGTDYKIRVSNPDGLAATSTGTVLYSETVSFSTSSGSLGSVGEGESASFSVSASSNSTIAYSVTSGSLPTGLSLNSSTGAITGTAPTVAADTTSTFTITATDAESQTASRSFSITVTNFAIDNSLRINEADSAYLSKTFSSAGNRKTFTWSGWIKKGNNDDSGYQSIFTAVALASTSADGLFLYQNKIHISWDFDDTGQSIRSTALFRDNSAWYHIVYAVDTTSATASERIRVYVNGVEVALDSTVGQNEDGGINRNDSHNIGRWFDGGSTNHLFDGYMAECHFIDGQQLTPTDFGETDSTTNNWIPKKYSGSYGTNGFYLDFSNSSDLGNDSSGNNNDFTPTNLAATDQTTDTPTNNFATLNPLSAFENDGTTYFNGNYTMAEGNLQAVSSGNAGTWGHSFSTIGMSSGKWYWENRVNSISNSTHSGVSQLFTSGYFQNQSTSKNINLVNGNSNSGNYNLSAFSSGDILMVALDMDNGEVYFGRNGTWGNSGNPATNTNPCFTGLDTTAEYFAGFDIAYTGSFSWNFGSPDFTISSGNSDENGYGSFEYAPPTGYLALCTNNLPNPTIADPTEYFHTQLYTGTGVARSVTNDANAGDFQPDWLWIKVRDNANNHRLFDTTRGEGVNGYYDFISNDTSGDEDGGRVTAISSNGFTVSSNSEVNRNTSPIVAWQWKANGGTTSSNTDGSITSTVQANTTAGFSIVTYTGNGTNGSSIGHGLNQAPEFIIVKRRDGTSNWVVENVNSLGMYLNLTDGATTSANVMDFSSSSIITFDTSNDTNRRVNFNGETYVAYCFAGIEGYSKFGSYTGNSNADGTFIYTGFKPAWVMTKAIFTQADSNNYNWWTIVDNTRSPYNNISLNDGLFANSSNAEGNRYSGTGSGIAHMDFLSNGFKLRGTSYETNQSGTYIYMAFAEAPFKSGTGATTIEGTAR